MKLVGIVILLAVSCCFAQEPGDFKPATSNVLDAQYPKVDSNSRVQIRFKAPDATKVKLNFWSGPKVDMEKAADGFWTFTTPPMAPGLHYYTLIVDGAEVSDPAAPLTLAAANGPAPSKCLRPGWTTTSPKMSRMGRSVSFGITPV